MTPKVYVVQNQHRHDAGNLVPKFDLEPARRHGELVFLLSPTCRPFNPRPVLAELHQKLFHYTPQDHLLLLGNPCLIGWAVAVAQHYGGGRVKLLQWDGRAHDYVSVDSHVMENRIPKTIN